MAFAVSELVLRGSSNSLEAKSARVHSRTCNSFENRYNRHSAYFTNNRVGPLEKNEKTYVFEASLENYVDGSEDQTNKDGIRSSRKILHEISKLSQMNISRLNNKCNYSVLTGADSTECLLKQHASPVEVEGLGTPTRGKYKKLLGLLKFCFKSVQYSVFPILSEQEPW